MLPNFNFMVDYAG